VPFRETNLQVFTNFCVVVLGLAAGECVFSEQVDGLARDGEMVVDWEEI
jgi:hypothetical protein